MRTIVWSCLVLGLTAARVSAQTPAPAAPPPAPSSSIEFGGLADIYYDFYSTKPTGDAPYRNFNTKHNSFAFSMAEVWLNKAPTADSRAGFRVKLNFGPATTNIIHATEPGGPSLQNIQEAYGSYLADVGKGLQLDAGIFVTPVGAEVIEAKDNPNYSRSLLFALAEPYYHSGVRATYSPSDKVTVMGGIVNGWNNVVDNNTGKTILGSVTIKPTAALSIIENYVTGPEQPSTNSSWRNFSDTVASYTYNPMVTLMGSYDYGHETYGGTTPSAHWQGVAAYAKIQATKVVTFTPRYEYYNDATGWSTGVVQNLNEFTGTLELKASDNLLWRVEYRGDFSNQQVFKNDQGVFGKSQNSIGFSVLYSFTSKIQ